ncbi:MAG: hypothetical protein E6H97_08345 [Chloroflexi bacterium]|nr:MAG: hypothetical protein E6H97_08345 [Chloroflexota bacterium]
METVGPPLSTTAWAAEFVAQTLEVLPVFMRDGELFWLKPVHGDSLRIGLAPASSPGDEVIAAMRWYPLTPRAVHSTSWRSEEGRVILTYVAAVEPPDQLPPDSLETLAVGRAELARGEAMAAPLAIGVGAVLEHALRHLAWLIRDDPAIATALAPWHDALAVYVPEPFRALA